MAAISSINMTGEQKLSLINYDLFQNRERMLKRQRLNCKVALEKHHEIKKDKFKICVEKEYEV